MIRFDEHLAEMKRTRELLKTAEGRRKHDLQKHYGRLVKQYKEAQFFMKGGTNETN